MKKWILALVCAAMLVGAVSCKREEPQDTDTEYTDTEINYDGVDVFSYIENIKYRGLELTFGGDNETNAEVMWANIYASVKIAEYPEDKVLYYFNQTKKSYMYSVGYNEEDYALLLAEKGTDEQRMMEDAKEMVKEDLAYEYIVKKEGIVLTEAEKAENFERYVARLSEQFGVKEEYLRTEMSDYVYDAMLRDKTTEFLFSVNK